jgi:hypothetical protein
VKVHARTAWAPGAWTNCTQGTSDVRAKLEIFRILTAASPGYAAAYPLSGILGEIGRATPVVVDHHTLGSGKVRLQGLENRTIGDSCD